MVSELAETPNWGGSAVIGEEEALVPEEARASNALPSSRMRGVKMLKWCDLGPCSVAEGRGEDCWLLAQSGLANPMSPTVKAVPRDAQAAPAARDTASSSIPFLADSYSDMTPKSAARVM